jgi:hypothetical protein
MIGDLWELTVNIQNYVKGVYRFDDDNQWKLEIPSYNPMSYDVSGTAFGNIVADANIIFYVSPRTFFLNESLIGCIARANVGPSSAVDFTITLKRSETDYVQVGTMTFTPGSVEGTFSAVNESAPIRVDRGDVLLVTSPSFSDPQLETISFTLCGYISI